MSDEKARRLTFVPPSPEEEKQIRHGLAEYTNEQAVTRFLAGSYLLIAKGLRQEVFLLSSKLWKLFQQIHPHRHPYYLGLFVGNLTSKGLQPSLSMLHHLADDIKASAKLIVNLKGEQRFLYGQSLTNHHVVTIPTDLQKDQKMLVMNKHHDGLGYGRLRRTKPEKITITNQLDLGWYLRRGR